MKKVTKVIAALLVAIVLAVGAFLTTFDLDAAINEQKAIVLPEVEKALGRKVSVGAVSTTILPILGARIADVRIAGQTPDDAPLLAADALRFEVDLWKALASAGTDVQLRALVLEGLKVTVVRRADGTLSYQDILDHIAQQPEAQAAEPVDPEVRRIIENMELSRVALDDGRIELIDEATGGAPAKSAINDLDVELLDVVLASPFEVRVAAGVLADTQNLEVKTRVGPVPLFDPEAPMPVDWITVKADGVDLAGLTPYLPADLPVRFKSVAASADLRVEDPTGSKGRIKVAGEASLTNLALIGAGGRVGRAFTLKATPNVEVDPAGGVVDLTGFSVALDDMTITADGRVKGLDGTPRFENLKIATKGLDLGRLQAMIPDIATGLPEGASLAGGLRVNATASGSADAQSVVVDINLDGANIQIPGALAKPSGTPLNFQLRADLTTRDVNLKAFALQAGDVALKLSGTIRDFENPRVNIKGGTGRFDINGPARLSPAVKDAIPADVKIAGQAEIDIKAQTEPDNVDVKLIVGIYGADLQVPSATVKGTGRIEVTARGNPTGNLTAVVDAGLAGLNLRVDGAVNKPAGTPMDVRLRINKTGDVLNVGELLAHIGPLKLSGGGSANLKSEALDVRATLDRFAINDLARIVPALADTPIAGAKVGLKVKLAGNPNDMKTVEAAIEDLWFALRSSSLTGDLSLKNPDAPIIRFAFDSPNLDLDEMFPPSDEAEEDTAATEPPEIVRKIDAQGTMRLAKGRAGGFPFRRFVAALTMKNGVVRFSELEFDSYDGHFSAAPTTVDIGTAVPKFDMKLLMKNVNIEKLLADQTEMKGRTLSGRVTTEIAVKGQGSAWEQIRQDLTGDLGMALANGRFHKADVQSGVVTPLAAAVPFLKKPRGQGGTALRDLAGRFTIADGKMTLVEPMKATTPQGPMSMDGWIGLDKALRLTGTIELAPSVVKAASGGKLTPSQALPIGLVLGGFVDDPEISGVELGDAAKILTEELAKGAAGQAVMEAKRKAEAAAAKAKAEVDRRAAQARKKAEDAERRARAEADRIKREAERRKKAAEDKARREAEKRRKAAEKKAKDKIKKLF